MEIFILVVLLIISLQLIPTKRKQKINEIIEYLKKEEKNADELFKYAVKENIKFFKAIKSFFSYVIWLVFDAKKIERNRLFELNDFSDTRWQEELHIHLTKLERKKFPGVLTPLKEKIVKFILEKNPKILVDMGSGGMELERQIISDLEKRSFDKKTIFIAVDNSTSAHKIAKENLENLKNVEVREYNYVDYEKIEDIKNNLNKKFTIVLCKNDIFNLDKLFPENYFDLIYFMKFRHHLNEKQKEEFHKIATKLSRSIFEYDDYMNWGLLIPQSIFAWRHPVLINGAIFSRLRDYNKEELISQRDKYHKLKFFKNGSYLIEYKKQ